MAGRRGFIHEHVEVGDDGGLPLRLAVALRKALLKLGGKKKVKGVNRRALGVLKAFTLTLPEGGSLLIDVEVVPGTADSGDLASDLGGLFEEVGRAARTHEGGVFLTIDEMHHLPAASLEALIVGLHRAHQLGLPVVIAGAGLPALAGRERRGAVVPRADVQVPSARTARRPTKGRTPWSCRPPPKGWAGRPGP